LRRWCSGHLKSTASAHELANNAEQLNQLVGQFKTAA
jgi:methyl-accepting chemotaxis protein